MPIKATGESQGRASGLGSRPHHGHHGPKQGVTLSLCWAGEQLVLQQASSPGLMQGGRAIGAMASWWPSPVQGRQVSFSSSSSSSSLLHGRPEDMSVYRAVFAFAPVYFHYLNYSFSLLHFLSPLPFLFSSYCTEWKPGWWCSCCQAKGWSNDHLCYWTAQVRPGPAWECHSSAGEELGLANPSDTLCDMFQGLLGHCASVKLEILHLLSRQDGLKLGHYIQRHLHSLSHLIIPPEHQHLWPSNYFSTLQGHCYKWWSCCCVSWGIMLVMMLCKIESKTVLAETTD